MTEKHKPMTKDEEYADAVRSYFDAMAEIAKQVRAGRELPAMFRPSERELEK